MLERLREGVMGCGGLIIDDAERDERVSVWSVTDDFGAEFLRVFGREMEKGRKDVAE